MAPRTCPAAGGSHSWSGRKSRSPAEGSAGDRRGGARGREPAEPVAGSGGDAGPARAKEAGSERRGAKDRRRAAPASARTRGTPEAERGAGARANGPGFGSEGGGPRRREQPTEGASTSFPLISGKEPRRTRRRDRDFLARHHRPKRRQAASRSSRPPSGGAPLLPPRTSCSLRRFACVRPVLSSRLRAGETPPSCNHEVQD